MNETTEGSDTLHMTQLNKTICWGNGKEQNTYSTRTDHDNRALGVSRQAESGSPNMDRRLVDGVVLIGSAGTRDFIQRGERSVGTEYNGHSLLVGCVSEIEQKVGTETITPFLRRVFGGVRLVLQNDTGDVDGIGVQFRTRRNRVVPGLETCNGRNDNIEGNFP